MKKIVPFMLSIGLLIGLVGCSTTATKIENEKERGQKIIVTTTIAQIGDAVKNIGGDYVEVNSLMGPGTDPHLYKAAQGDIEKLNKADIIFYNGLHLEGKMNEIFEKMREQKPTYAIAEAIPTDLLKGDSEDSTVTDPHVWFDITLWIFAVEEIRNGLIELDPGNAEDYNKNADQYINKLKELDDYAKAQIQLIPEQGRVLVTAHDAFNYFGSAYGLEVMGLQGLSTDSEYGLKDVQTLVNTLVDREIKAVFMESSISDRSINAVVEGAKQKGHKVVIGGELYSDAMGVEGTAAETYEGMFKHNIDTIVSALK